MMPVVREPSGQSRGVSLPMAAITARAEGCVLGGPRPMLAGVTGLAALARVQTTMSRRQWSLAPHSSTPFMARTFTLSWNPREAKT